MKGLKKAGMLLFMCSIAYMSPRVTVVNIDGLKHETVHKNNDTLYVVNFWATWCDPCVKELPYFQAAYKKYASHKVKMVFVSLNSVKDLDKVKAYTGQHNLEPEVLLLNAGNPNVWINEIDSSWSGALPATIMYRKGKKIYFHEGDFSQEKLNSTIQSKLNKS